MRAVSEPLSVVTAPVEFETARPSLAMKYRNYLTSLEICNKNIIIDKKFVNFLENEFKSVFDSENNFNNKWIETKLKGLQIIGKIMRN